MNPYIYMLVHTLIYFAQTTIKNPKSVAAERGILVQLQSEITQLIAAIDALPK